MKFGSQETLKSGDVKLDLPSGLKHEILTFLGGDVAFSCTNLPPRHVAV